MKKYNLDFCFKGSRTYVHGTDIFNQVIEILKNDFTNENIDLSFHGIARTNIDLVSEKPDNEELVKFAFKYSRADGSRNILYAVENGIKIDCRYEYPEENICELSIVDIENQIVTLEQNSSYSFVENSVALNKHLLENIFPDAGGKWYFTRFQLKEIPNKNFYPLKLILKANFNFKLTKTEIFIDNNSVGYVYFSLV